MKLRAGFVSNSSSSSFVLTVSKGTTEEEIRAIVEKKIGKMEGFFIPGFKQDLIDIIMDCKGDKVNLVKDLEWENKWIADNPDSSTDERDRLVENINSDLDYYRGGFSDNGNGPIQAWLCYTSFKIDEDGFVMENYAGY